MSDRAVIRLVKGRREPVLAAGGDGPHNPGMEARLSRLETDFGAMRADLSATRSDTAYIRGRLETLPTSWQMIGAILAGNVALVGMLFAALKALGHQ